MVIIKLRIEIISFLNPMKMAKCIMELERIYGIRQGSTNSKGVNVGDKMSLTQVDIAKEILNILLYGSYSRSKTFYHSKV